MPFRKADVRRVQNLFDEAVRAPFEAEVTLSNNNMSMTVSVTDPANEALNVATCTFEFNPAAAMATFDQPRSREVFAQCGLFADVCAEYVSPG